MQSSHYTIAIVTLVVFECSLACPAFPQGKGDGRPHSKQGYKQGLEGMNNEDKQGRLCLSHTIKHENCLHGKVPRACTIRCGNQHGKGSYHESHESS